MPRQALTERQRIFARELVYNASSQTDAAIAAGYSDKHARSAGARLAANANVKAEIERLRGRLETRATAKVAFTRENALEILANLASDDEIAARDRIAALRAYADLEAWNQPSRSEHVSVHADLSQLLAGSGLSKDDLRALAFPVSKRLTARTVDASPLPDVDATSIVDAPSSDITTT